MIVPGIRSLALSAALGIGIGVYLGAFAHWPTFVAIGLGALLILVSLLIAASLGEDPAAADAAWREAAPDLVIRHEGPGDGAAPDVDAPAPATHGRR